MNQSINQSISVGYFSGDKFFLGASTVMGDFDEVDAPSAQLLLLLDAFLFSGSESFDEALHDLERAKVAATLPVAICCPAVVPASKPHPPLPQRTPRSRLSDVSDSLKCSRPEKKYIHSR